MPRQKKQPEAQVEAPATGAAPAAEEAREAKPEPKKPEPVTVERNARFSVRSVGNEYAVWDEALNARVSPFAPAVEEPLALMRALGR